MPIDFDRTPDHTDEAATATDNRATGQTIDQTHHPTEGHPDDHYRVRDRPHNGVAVAPTRSRPCADPRVQELLLEGDHPAAGTYRVMQDTRNTEAFIIGDDADWCALDAWR